MSWGTSIYCSARIRSSTPGKRWRRKNSLTPILLGRQYSLKERKGEGESVQNLECEIIFLYSIKVQNSLWAVACGGESSSDSV